MKSVMTQRNLLSNLCDTIENIRATLKPNLKEALKHDKEEE